MAESIVSAILEQLTAITIGKASEAWCLVRGVEEEVRRLERNFKSLQLELEDAEEREYQDKRLKHWLDKFRDVSYDMEDVLDDWKLAIGQLQSVGGSVRKWKDFKKDAHGNIISCKMHDLVHEFVRFLTQDRFVTKKLVGSSTLDLSSSKARHLRLGIQNCCLNLQKLADGIGKLINLSYLCTNDCPRLTYYPKGISNLTSLERLSGIKMRIDQNDGDHLSIGDLENLDLLGGNLSVELIGDTLDWNEAERAKLHKKIHLKRMDIWICSEAIKKEEVLQALKPPSNFPIVLFDYWEWFNSNDACIKRLSIKENIRVSLMVQKAALQFIAAAGPPPPISAESDEDPTT